MPFIETYCFENEVVDECAHCGDAIYDGDRVVAAGDELYCSYEHFGKSLGVYRVIAREGVKR